MENRNSSHDLSKTDIQNMIDNSIKDAKLERYEEQINISKNQMNFFFKVGGSLLAVFGLVLPILISILNTERVNDAINTMEKSVERLINTQLRKPNIIGVKDGIEINESTNLQFDFKIINNNRSITGDPKIKINILNNGDAPARELRILLYIESDSLINKNYKYKPIGWKSWPYSDENNYPSAYIYSVGEGEAIVIILDASENIPVDFDYRFFNWQNRKIKEINAILKVYYGQPLPYRIPVKIKFNDQM